ncbi:MAG: hypothetical protein D3923_07415 [Candidatus Electrothrix sp. AR3]|nr:hypothetical protein [Candidatus Electrothrix sp. AR3]
MKNSTVVNGLVCVAVIFSLQVAAGGVAQAASANDISLLHLETDVQVESNVLSATCKGRTERDKSGKIIRRCPLRCRCR